MIGVIMPLWCQNEATVQLTLRTVPFLRATRPAKLFVVTTRLTVRGPEQLRGELAAVCPLPVEVIHDPGVDRSVAGAWNRAIPVALEQGAELICLTANDVMPEATCLDTLAAFGEANPDVDLWSGIDTRDRPNIDPSIVSDGADFAHCMFRRQTRDSYGEFDHWFKPCYFEDNDFSARIILGGGKVRTVHAARFYHLGSMTAKLDGEAAHHIKHWFGINRARFAAKWGTGDPATSAEDAHARYFKTPWNDPALTVGDWNRE